MSTNTSIEWCDHTFNPWEGCQKVSPGCDHCYAEARNARFAGGQAVNWGPGAPRRRTSIANWNLPKRWNAQADAFMAQHGRRQRVFCASLADVFDNAVPAQWRRDLFDLIEATPNLDWLLLTKRIGNARSLYAEAYLDSARPWPANVWLGATIVNPEEAARDIYKLLQVPARVRFLSMEPLLGSVNLRSLEVGEGELDALKADTWEQEIDRWRDTDEDWIEQFEDRYDVNLSDGLTGPMHSTIDWVIVGGESGPGARPMHPDWARSLRDQCEAAGVPFLFKQWGEWTPGENVERHRGTVATAKWWNDAWSYHEEDLASTDGHIDDAPDLYRVGKKAAGRLLDGRTWDGFPS